MVNALRKMAYRAALVCFFLLTAEITARLEDWLHLGMPLLATPDRERDLLVRDADGTHGRPYGRFKKWKLNEFGFRGGEMSAEPPPETTRVMILGASEAFGLYESEGKEFPAQLGQLLAREGRYEVVNAAIPGMTARSMSPYWERWASRFRPDVVIVYASPLFYLNDWASPARPPRPSAGGAAAPEGPSPRPRLWLRFKDVVHVPAVVQNWRDDRTIAAITAGKGEDWYLRSVPEDRVQLFRADLERLAASIKARGSRPVLVTHACRSEAPPRPEDLPDLHGMLVHVPRPTPEVMAEFEAAAARAVADLGRERGIPVVDAAAVMGGRRECFADLVHFNDAGAEVIAGLLADPVKAASVREAYPGG